MADAAGDGKRVCADPAGVTKGRRILDGIHWAEAEALPHKCIPIYSNMYTYV